MSRRETPEERLNRLLGRTSGSSAGKRDERSVAGQGRGAAPEPRPFSEITPPLRRRQFADQPPQPPPPRPESPFRGPSPIPLDSSHVSSGSVRPKEKSDIQVNVQISPARYQSMAARFRDTETNEPKWGEMREAIEEENRKGIPLVQHEATSGHKVPQLAALYGNRLASKSRKEIQAERLDQMQRKARQEQVLASSGYQHAVMPDHHTRWFRQRPAFDRSERKYLTPQRSSLYSGGGMRRAMSAPNLYSSHSPPSPTRTRPRSVDDSALQEWTSKWTKPMRERIVYHKSHQLQSEQDMERVAKLSSLTREMARLKLNREQRRRVRGKSAGVNVVVNIEGLKMDTFPIPEENEEEYENE